MSVMAKPISFNIEKRVSDRLGRAGVINTPNGSIQTPAFVTVGTKATVKALTPEQVSELGAQVVLANTYHLYLEPGDDVLVEGGGLHKYMNWSGPTMTDSGGFQAFSLGAAFDKGVGKLIKSKDVEDERDGRKEISTDIKKLPLAKVTEDGVEFRSHIDGSKHFFTPEKSIEIQHNIGADMIFAFDECTSPTASYEYQKEAMDRTHRWAGRCLEYHKKSKNSEKQGLFGIVQGGRYEDLRKESARTIASMDFDGFGIGGSFNKEDMESAVRWVNEMLPEDKPRHLLGIGEPSDLFGGVLSGADLFDCVAPTRMARNGTLHTLDGRINITNARFARDHSSIDDSCTCYTCRNYTRSYVSHLFRAGEMLGATLASIHNLHFIVKLVADMRQAILEKDLPAFRESFEGKYYGGRC